jgi:hypothetical protein
MRFGNLVENLQRKKHWEGRERNRETARDESVVFRGTSDIRQLHPSAHKTNLLNFFFSMAHHPGPTQAVVYGTHLTTYRGPIGLVNCDTCDVTKVVSETAWILLA